MTFAIFVMWVLMGMLAGLAAGPAIGNGGHGLKRDVMLGLLGAIGLGWLVRTVGLVSGSGLFAASAVALVGAAIVIVAQRRLRPAEPRHEPTADAWWRWGLGAAVLATMGWMIFGPVTQPAATAAAVEDKVYQVTPGTLKVKAGILSGEVTDIRVTERIEQGSGRVVSPAKLTARLALTNTSSSQSVRLVTGTIEYLDAQGRPIAVDGNRADPVVKFSGSDRLDPGQETAESVNVEFPVAALAAAALKSIRLDLAYVPSPYRKETVTIPIAIGAP